MRDWLVLYDSPLLEVFDQSLHVLQELHVFSVMKAFLVHLWVEMGMERK
jgi:hypothetical protein